MFDRYGNERLIAWREFRDKLETSTNPLLDVAIFWAGAPFVNRYLDHSQVELWPNPWKLIIDGRFDDLAITLGMLYTIKLTERFRDVGCDVYQSLQDDKKTLLIVDNSIILNWHYRALCSQKDIEGVDFMLLWSKHDRV